MRSRSPRRSALALLAAGVAGALLSSLAPVTAAPAPPGVPTAFDLDVRSGGDPAFAISWSDPVEGAPASYEVLVDGRVRVRTDATTHSAVVEGLAEGGTYRVAVRSVGAEGSGRSTGVAESRVLTRGAATPVLTTNPTNPLAGHEWGVYLGRAEPSYVSWLRAEGATKAAIAEMALQPKAKWFGRWLSDGEVGGKVRDYIAAQTGGDPDVLVQLTVFRMDPWEGENCRRLPTAAEKAGYRRYLGAVADAIGDTLTAVVLQPDGPFAGCAPGGSRVYSDLIGESARLLEALPRTSVYLDMGSPGWFRDDVTEAVDLLLAAGVADTRGFALSVTHMDTTRQSVRFGSRVAAALAERGVPGTHFVVDTADNGRGFSGEQYRRKVPKPEPIGWAPMCRTPQQRLCVALGVPPTTDVADPRWGLPPAIARLAAQHVDGYLWINRPWNHRQTDPFRVAHAVALASQNPYG